MQNRFIRLSELTKLTAQALDITIHDLNKSNIFEQAIYDIARSSITDLPELNVTGKARYGIENEKIITIKYYNHTDIARMTQFYLSFFPETVISVTRNGLYYPISIRFSAGPFIEKILPEMRMLNQKLSNSPSHPRPGLSDA